MLLVSEPEFLSARNIILFSLSSQESRAPGDGVPTMWAFYQEMVERSVLCLICFEQGKGQSATFAPQYLEGQD